MKKLFPYFSGFILGGVVGVSYCHTTSPLWMEFIGGMIVCGLGYELALWFCSTTGQEVKGEN